MHTVPKVKSAIQSEFEAISTETATEVLNSFISCLHKVCDLWEYQMVHVLLQQKNFLKCAE
jgi:hypothetical protein